MGEIAHGVSGWYTMTLTGCVRATGQRRGGNGVALPSRSRHDKHGCFLLRSAAQCNT